MSLKRIGISLCFVVSGLLQAGKATQPKKYADKKTVADKKSNAVKVHKALATNEKGYSLPKDAHLEDCIVILIYCQDGDTIVLTKKDLERVSINGVQQTRDEIIDAHMMAHYARYRYKMEVPEEIIEKYIQAIMDQHGITRDQIKQMFQQVGYSFQEGRDQLKMMYLIDNLLNYKIKSRIIIPEEKIVEYHKEHPVSTDTVYEIQTGFIPSDQITEEEIEGWKKEKKHFKNIEWSDAYTLTDDEISEDRSFIKKLSKHEISDLERISGGYEVLRLVSKEEGHQLSLDERRKEIIEILRAPLYEKHLSEFKQEMAKEFEVVILN